MSSTAAATFKPQGTTREIGQAVKHSFVYGLGGVLQKAVGVLLLPFYTHYLRPSDYGILEILNLTMTLTGMFLAMGIPSGVLRYYAAAQTEDEKRRIVSSAYVCVAAIGFGLFAGGWMFAGPASRLLLGPSAPRSYLLLMLAYFVLGYINTVPVAYLRAKEASGQIVGIETTCFVLMLGLSIYLVAGRGQSIFGMLLAQFLVGAAVTPVLAVWMYREVGISVDSKLLRKLLSFGAPLVLSGMTMFILNFSDRLFLQRFRSLDAVGIYSVGYKFGYIINFLIIQPFNTMWMARMYQVHRRDDCRQIFKQVFVLYSVLLIVSGLAASVFSGELLKVIADVRYASGKAVIAPIVLAYVLFGIGSYLQLGMFLAGRTGLIGAVSLAAAAINLGLNYVLIRQYGMMGAAYATALGFLALAVGSYFCSQRVWPIELGLGRVLRGIALAFVVYQLASAVHSESTWLTVMIKGCLLIASLGLIRIMGILQEKDMQVILSLASSGVLALRQRGILRRAAQQNVSTTQPRESETP